MFWRTTRFFRQRANPDGSGNSRKGELLDACTIAEQGDRGIMATFFMCQKLSYVVLGMNVIQHGHGISIVYGKMLELVTG